MFKQFDVVTSIFFKLREANQKSLFTSGKIKRIFSFDFKPKFLIVFVIFFVFTPVNSLNELLSTKINCCLV